MQQSTFMSTTKIADDGQENRMLGLALFVAALAYWLCL
jgi:hypothetical protein